MSADDEVKCKEAIIETFDDGFFALFLYGTIVSR
jgi:hypothetical protein